jgi:uroporphyrinogen-III synthase
VVGSLSGDSLGTELEARGAEVDRVIAYQTVPDLSDDDSAIRSLLNGAIDVVALASPSALRNLLEMLGPRRDCLTRVRLACIGPTTASAVREMGFEPAAVAEEHTLDGLVRAVCDACTGQRIHDPA